MPLAGVRVLEDARFVAAPFSGLLLRWMGATVVRLQGVDGRPTCGFEDPRLDALMATFLDAGKETRVDPECTGDSLAEELAQADVFLSDRTISDLRGRGLDPLLLREKFPRLVFVSLTGYGLDGPHADWPASELTTYHAGGEGYLLPAEPVHALFPDRPPVRAGRSLGEYDAGLCTAIGAVAGLVRRERSGEGEIVEVSAQEVQLGLHRTTLSRCLYEHEDADRSYRGYDYAGTLRCREGYLCIRPVEDHQFAALAAASGRPELAEDPRFATRNARFDHGDELTAELELWSAERGRDELRAALLDSGCPAGPFLEPHEVLEDPRNRERQVFAPCGDGRAPSRLFRGRLEGERSAPPAAAIEPDALSGRPLAGLRVLDFTWVAAGPHAAELLAFMGAEVIKVESRERPDLFRRRQDGIPDLDTSIRFVDLNQGKRSICLDLKAPEDVAVVEGLAARSDLVIDNFRPGVRDRLGLSDAVLRAANPRLVVVSISGFGHEGAERDRPGYASIFNAESGMGAMTGYPDAPPADVRDSNDLRVGMAACLAGVGGLFAAARDGRASTFDIAARDALIALQGDVFLEASLGGRPTRSTNALGELCPYGCYPAPDDAWVAVSVRDEDEWRALAASVGGALEDPALTGLQARAARREEVEEALVAWLAGRPADRSVRILAEAGVPAALSSAAGVLHGDPHLRSRNFFRTIDYDGMGELIMLGSPLRFGEPGTPPPVVAPPPRVDQDRDYVLEELLGDPARSREGASR
jgi:crotonobetainyl-CoA:carnitine CoA-transferase CaiB-like acyl-CoA transferase